MLWHNDTMNDAASHTVIAMTRREALDQLVSAPLDELRRLAQVLESEQKVLKSLIRERARQPERRALQVVGGGQS
jgi:hypothetical protein